MDEEAGVTSVVCSLKNRSPDEREAAADRLGRLGDRTAVPELLEVAAADPELVVRHAAVKTLGTLGGSAAVKGLVELWATHRDSDDGAIHLSASEALERIGADAVAALIEALNDLNWRVRWMAIMTLRRGGDQHALGHVRPLLGDEHEMVRSAASEALGSLG